jgi:hypothetical protein
MVDTKNNIKAALIQRGLFIPNNFTNDEDRTQSDPIASKLLKNYLMRK